MFILTRILSLFLLLNQCGNTAKLSDENPIAQQETAIPSKNKTLAQEKLMAISYQATSRGVFFEVVVNDNEVVKSKDRSGKDKKVKQCSENEWIKIQSELKDIDLEKINELEAPSNDKSVDRSLHATVTITFPTQVYTSISFDHGNPPEQIASLVNTILSLAESIE